MRKITFVALTFVSAILFYFTFASAEKVFRSSWQLPKEIKDEQSQYRIVLVTQELETPFWDKVGKGARDQAKKDGVSLEVWGSYGKNQEDFLKKIEIAIDSKVDGIIVQGLDTDEFKNLTKIKAASHGIPIITVANDVPMGESLRKTYVGSDQYLAGKMIARQLISDMGPSGIVILMYDSQQEYYQKNRLKGIQAILKDYPKVTLKYAPTDNTRDKIIATTKDVMNQMPNVNAFVAINANITEAMVQEISRRSPIKPFYIYSFDDSPESKSQLKQGTLDGMIEQSPATMGSSSVNLMVKWLNNEIVPLNKNGYFTDIRMVKAMNDHD
ncbi:sugar ABC transporter substrate-binding protein [Heyndrickxia vini]|uniref:Substrate-binding domain-containing protein n=1 Tax=Heyndrickxia vini TaxID=1476025 RepID=A0ABX7E0W4_9BACI|nr:substrate-binding domain-containing protein [Heyndrickxia vini]QQZ09378.1 substrate-binding domain-containing protein [Heyndrickxia vini]